MTTKTYTEQLPDSVERKLTHNGTKNNLTNNNFNKNDQSAYDEIMKLSFESKFLMPLRQLEKRMGFITPIQWVNTFFIVLLHIVAVITFVDLMTNHFSWPLTIFAILMGQLSGFGVTAGAHRYWCHRSYKAEWPLRVILIICFSISGQNTIYDWVRDHRVHHKYSETSADPHDANRGFFFSHVGWLMMKKHPDVIREGQKIDMSDITNDPMVRFHTKYFNIFKIAFCFVIPSLIPILVWGANWREAVLSQVIIRYTLSLNFTWAVNSFAHLWGNKPYDKHIMPSENWAVSFVAMGEGWHNYHHTFPWDYKAAELGMSLNTTTTLLNFFARLGWAYDLKEASPSLVDSVAKKRGDSSERISSKH